MRLLIKNLMDFSTRDFESVLPECGNVTIISINDLNEMGIYVSLIEFDNIEGLLLFSEVSRRRIRSMAKLIKIGKKEIVSIIRVDTDKSYIDVSKRQITDIETNYMRKKRKFGKIANLISNNISRYLCLNFEETRLRWVWQLGRKYCHVIKAFKMFSKFKKYLITSIDLTNREVGIFSDNIKQKISDNSLRIEVEFEMLSFSSNGVDVLKDVILSIKKNPQFLNIQCKTLVTPRYFVCLLGKSKKKTIKVIIAFLKSISNKILTEKGTFQIFKISIN